MSIKSIQSKDNAPYKAIKRLAQNAAYRKKCQQALLDGVHLHQSYLESGGIPLSCWVSEESLSLPEVQNLMQNLSQITPCFSLPSSLFQAISQVENGVEMLSVIQVPQSPLPLSLQETAVLLDGVQDPGNVGSILRSAAGAGIRRIICAEGTAQIWSSKVLRAGMGAHFALHINENVDLVKFIQQSPMISRATSLQTTQSLYDTDLRQACLWVLGNEGQGVSPDVMQIVTQKIIIPQSPHIESLNVAASAAICFFEQVRQNLKSA